MFSYDCKLSECNICRREYTSFHFEATPGSKVYVCQYCYEAARYNFIWICLNCGESYQRPKNIVMNRISGYGISEAETLYEARLIQGLCMCAKCNPEGMWSYVVSSKEGARLRKIMQAAFSGRRR